MRDEEEIEDEGGGFKKAWEFFIKFFYGFNSMKIVNNFSCWARSENYTVQWSMKNDIINC